MAKKSVFSRQRPPRVIEICGHKIKVKIVKELIDDNDELLAGAYNGETKTIFIAKTEQWREVLWHEALHCCWHLTGASEGLTASKEEQLVLAAEYGLGPLLF
jgi:hypothetical protein